MRENRTSGSEGGGTKRNSLPLSKRRPSGMEWIRECQERQRCVSPERRPLGLESVREFHTASTARQPGSIVVCLAVALSGLFGGCPYIYQG